ncbi:MAG: hypothetical protein K2Q11_10110 [Burkholderiaceae bacterium]|nr:hypothetical protein [Burkholderiaceae bacterium]
MSLTTLPHTSPTRRQRTRRLWTVRLGLVLLVLVLWAVFVLYTQPDFMVMLADQVWACF